MNLKKASATEYMDLKKICTDAYALNFHDHWNEGGLGWYLEQEFSVERIMADLADDTTEYFFIEHKLKQVGFLKIKTTSSTDLPFDHSVVLEKIYLLPECKGLGIGKWALGTLIEKLEARGTKKLFLAVIDTNLNAIAFYEKLGFSYHSKTRLEFPYFKEELKGMHRMVKELNSNK
ncbi:GNAT family N-acetyltransferase [Cellulophaga baltica]|uniref:N-acetyltransferase domain-containing protein n=1 Tax=Cellulophaga baltica 18 TaxID=1348584 RepID=A0AAU8RTA6_9FLAO|nr:GNAT family N-acetyltransferase [Cellulophaga baltica]AIZ40949.1 hypothetical protein M666_04885 [Cellulophaga baltica 18]